MHSLSNSIPYVFNNYVLRFEIAMDDPMTVDVTNSLKDIAEDRYDFHLF